MNHWVVQNNMFNEEGFERLKSALERLGVAYTLVKVVPFAHTIEPDINPEGGVVVMGTYSLCDIAHARGWKPGSFDNANFDYWLQAQKWPGKMLNSGGFICKFAKVPEQPIPFFIRPVHDTKSFIGSVMDWPSFSTWRDGVLALTAEDMPTITGDTEVLVAAKQEIYNECRLWMVDGRFETGSLYKVGTIKRYAEIGRESRVVKFAEDLAGVWAPSRAFVMDVADTPQGLKVVEINNFNAAGFYAGDMQKLVAAIEAMVY